MSDIQIEKRRLGDGVGVLTLSGRLNMLAAPELKAVIDSLVDAGSTRVVVDLSQVTFLDSSGLGALIAALKKARQAGGDLRVAGPHEQVLTVLRLTNLDKVIRPHPTVEAATDGW